MEVLISIVVNGYKSLLKWVITKLSVLQM